MADVRFSILCGPSSLDPATMGFPPHETTNTIPRQSTGGRRPDEPAGGWYAWRLMASNNRRLGSGVASYATRSRVVAAITELREHLELLQARVSTDPNNGTWRWRAELAGQPIAVCPHWYERERDCRTGYAKFVVAVSRAHIAEGGTVLRDHRASLNVTVPRLRPADTGRPRPWPTY